jgi:hypothetical protein
MDELLQELDPEFYREARLRLARAEINYLLRERAARERRAKIPLGTQRELSARLSHQVA